MKMKFAYVLAALGSLSAVPAMAQAPEAAPAAAAAPTISRGVMIFSAEGRRIGRIDRLRGENVTVIYNGRFVEIPSSSLSAGERGLTTSLKSAELAKL